MLIITRSWVTKRILSLLGEGWQLHNFASFERRFVRTDPHTSPVGGFPGIGVRIAIFHQCCDKLMRQMRMGSSVPCALGEAQVGILGQIIDPLGCERADPLGQPGSIIFDFDPFGYLVLWLFGGVKHWVFAFDQRPFKGLLVSIDIKAFSVLAGSVEQAAVNACSQIRILEFDVGGLNGEG